ncbi:pre-mRNA-processing factor, putative [Candida dubliniensis CD36]|uniref:Pre-mRNA-processing factor 19 n=1 Tax=Candida dubliniensis (strain CD36 / ATCC MYA-646 / CBS 7987 / NCPF 3949 / NRRL Y-17841) TaxID=573826 RepID=B9WEX2_CANDC|nr:pre-mRNA-processing factor, putative [Candida dubliniensis CD36]CAX43235.1 pre-mRNA-processing factor, putative [Candida dubliniensis CD36]
MICSISGEIATDPVVSPKSGSIFQRKHIVNYIATSGTDPINDEPLTESELISLKVNEKATAIAQPPPPDPSNSSIPSLLSTFQNEWDAIVLEVFTLKKQLQSAKQELSIALYRQDAAVNVAAKAIRERDEAREALEKLSSTINLSDVPDMNNKPEEMEPKAKRPKNSSSKESSAKYSQDKDGAKIDSEQIENIVQARDELFKLHKSQKVKLAFDVDTFLKQKGVDIQTIFKGEKISTYVYNKDIDTIVAVSQDKVIKYSFDDGASTKLDLKNVKLVEINNNGVVAVSSGTKIMFSNFKTIELNCEAQQIICHPSLDFFVVLAAKEWFVISTDSIVASYNGSLSLGALHYDGEILATKNDNKIKLYSIVSGDELGTFTPTYENIAKLEFATNGYWLLALSTADNISSIQIFDLRKGTEVQNLQFNEVATKKIGNIMFYSLHSFFKYL